MIYSKIMTLFLNWLKSSLL